MITVDYTKYCEGQKDWADRLSRQAEATNLPEMKTAAVAALSRTQTLAGRHSLAVTRQAA